jgi:ABC-type antimicrobial peptide transport system permease subunit
MQYFVPFSQVPAPPFPGAKGSQARGLLLRASVPAEALAGSIRRLIVGRRTDLPFVQVVPYPSLLERQMRPWRIGTTLLALFSGIALVVAASGLYATFAHAVVERRREMAIRLALGADPGGVRRLVLREALTLAAAGAAAGCGAAGAGGRWVQALLFETSAADPLVLASATAALLLVAAAATWLPARQAAQADPGTLLRLE